MVVLGVIHFPAGPHYHQIQQRDTREPRPCLRGLVRALPNPFPPPSLSQAPTLLLYINASNVDCGSGREPPCKNAAGCHDSRWGA